MNKAPIIATLTLLPILAYAPLTSAAPEDTKSMTEQPKVIKLDQPLQLGDIMPNFVIDNAAGGTHELETLLEDGPVLLTFYRGSWCPYCITELSSVQKRLDKITDTGAKVLAISPEIPTDTTDLVKQKDYGFLFGTDHDNKLAKQLALSFKLDPKTIKKYREYGIDLPESNDSKKWELPIPATYVIDTDGTIKYAFVEEDYKKRADYDKVLDTLREMAEAED
tara:strand:- start:144470 stop:145135 length:666 start_codon:yes stop_codon:yes gene_type:complete